jgi:hypothetical protein
MNNSMKIEAELQQAIKKTNKQMEEHKEKYPKESLFYSIPDGNLITIAPVEISISKLNIDSKLLSLFNHTAVELYLADNKNIEIEINNIWCEQERGWIISGIDAYENQQEYELRNVEKIEWLC